MAGRSVRQWRSSPSLLRILVRRLIFMSTSLARSSLTFEMFITVIALCVKRHSSSRLLIGEEDELWQVVAVVHIYVVIDVSFVELWS